ncbi:branched-chain amino acid ABC transporter permease [Paraburkholderia sp.]|uniref:branched-chain amino acid ABC transporter permease n=1 Tax=Paraburkholderia sp. TaxID=1926495 RepID=UPI0039E22D84
MKPVLILVAALAVALVASNAYVVNLLVVSAIYAIPAVGLSMLMGYTGQISLGHGAFVAFGAYLAAWLTQTLDLDPWLGVIAATLASALIAWCIGWIVFRLKGHHLAMATLALALIVHIVLVQWRSVTGGPDGIAGIPSLTIGPLSLASDQAVYVLAWALCALGLAMAHNLATSPMGLAMRTVSESERVALSLGIDAARVKRKVMALSGAYAGLGGALYAYWMGYISPDPFNVGFSIKLLLIVALGGAAGVWNVLFGTFVVVIVSEWLKPFGRLDVVIYGALLVSVMIFMRDGLAATLAAQLRRLRARPSLRPLVPGDVLRDKESL